MNFMLLELKSACYMFILACILCAFMSMLMANKVSISWQLTEQFGRTGGEQLQMLLEQRAQNTINWVRSGSHVLSRNNSCKVALKNKKISLLCLCAHNSLPYQIQNFK